MARTERKRNDDINDIFSIFDEEFEEMRARMDTMMERMLAGQYSFGEDSSVYGVSMQIGPDGKPHIHEFGNAKQLGPAEEKRLPSREPLIDVIQEKDRVRVIVELPGVQKNDIAVSAQDIWLDISVDIENKKFSKRIELPCPIRPDSATAIYKNGVLEITLGRSPPKRRKKKTIVE
jgi:HSP20 family protein